MKLSILESFKGIKIFSTLFYALLHCCFYTNLNRGEPCSLSSIAK